MAVADVTVLYDRDCGFCRWLLAQLLAWDRARRLRPVAIQDEEGQRLLAGMSEERKLASWHLIGADGEIHSGGAGFPPLFEQLPGGGPFAALTGRFPGLSERAYRLVADNRVALSKPVPQSAKRRATAAIDARARG